MLIFECRYGSRYVQVHWLWVDMFHLCALSNGFGWVISVDSNVLLCLIPD